MTDKELLELAAKAAGIELDWSFDEASFNGNRWNPLTDDGDALRLAVKLGMSVFCPDTYDWTAVVQIYEPEYEPDIHITEEATKDFGAATRRAIVRAAAEIGRGM